MPAFYICIANASLNVTGHYCLQTTPDRVSDFQPGEIIVRHK